MNKLKEYLLRNRIRQTDIAKFIGSYQSDISKFCNGKKNIPPHFCKPIEEFTCGEVTVRDLRPKDWKRYWPKG